MQHQAIRASAFSFVVVAAALAAQAPQPVPVRPPDPSNVNAPVAPEAIYVGRQGPAGLSIIDLNGLGQGTGDPANTRFPLNPNVGRPDVTPPLAPGASRIDAGSEGVLTLTRDDRGGVVHLGDQVRLVGDIHIGQPLDLVYNNEATNRLATSANQLNPATMQLARGNTISVAPHPNPPRLLPGSLAGEEPSVTTSGFVSGRVTTSAPPCLPSPLNVLVPGNPFDLLHPGLFDARYSAVFYGPQPARPVVATPYCPFTSRQQIGHFLYVVDRAQRRLQVVNSNRMTLLASIPLADPYSAAMAPNLRWLAVSNYSSGTVSFVDVDPLSPTFHRVLGDVAVGRGPTGLAWQPEGEDLLVCNSLDSTVSIISGATFGVRSVLRNVFRNPMEVAVSARQFRVGLNSMTYFAVIQNGDGSLVAYESGPAPIGRDATFPLPLIIPRAMVLEARSSSVTPQFVIATRNVLGQAQVAVLEVYDLGGRQWSLRTIATYGGQVGGALFSGNQIADLAFDECYNDGASADVPSPLPGLLYARHSGKGFLKQGSTGIVAAHRSQLMFVACSDTGKVDVVDLVSGLILKSIDAPGVTTLSHYWRQ
ncbi:MAG: hypothetical protein R3F56_02955 [Planctomycetota bacterium]